MKNKCYLLTGYKDPAKLIAQLVRRKGIYRITNHHPIIKVKTRKPARFPCKSKLVEDRTQHWDAMYWDFVMAIFRHAIKHKQDPRKVITVTTHYLCNLFNIAEEGKFLYEWGKRRMAFEQQMTAKQDHGWEMDELAKKDND